MYSRTQVHTGCEDTLDFASKNTGKCSRQTEYSILCAEGLQPPYQYGVKLPFDVSSVAQVHVQCLASAGLHSTCNSWVLLSEGLRLEPPTTTGETIRSVGIKPKIDLVFSLGGL